MEIKNKKHYNKFIFNMKENYERELEDLTQRLKNKKYNDIVIDNKKIKIISNKKFMKNNQEELKTLFCYLKEFDGILFCRCIFNDINIEININKNMYYLDCVIENSYIEFEHIKYNCESKVKIYFLNSWFNKLVLENSLSNIFIYNNNFYKDDTLGIKLINCTNSEIVVINKNKNIFNLILENSKYVGIFLYSLRKLITILDDESNSMKYFFYNVEFENVVEINSLKQVTSRYYRYLKINYDENRFVYYELLKYLEYLLGNKYKKIYALLFKYLTGYFINPIKIILICTIIIIVSSIFYLFTGISVDNTRIILYDVHNILSLKITDLLKAMYLSVTTFSTLGYGNIIPIKYGEVVASIEMLLGAIYISIFTGTIFKRYID
ncbi:Ion channel protein [Clostridium botulinum]|nr:Ion channel protein [Clostridium botulinum]